MKLLGHHRTIRNFRTVRRAHAHGEFAKYDAERLRRAAIEPTSDFDQIEAELQRLEAPPPPEPKPKKPGRKEKGGGE